MIVGGRPRWVTVVFSPSLVRCLSLFNTSFPRLERCDSMDYVGNVTIRCNVRLRKAAIALLGLAEGQGDKPAESFFDLISGSLVQFYLLSDEEQAEKVREVSAVQKVLSVFVQSLEPDELLMLLPLIQTIQAEASVAGEDETKEAMQKVRQSLDDIAGRMNSARLQLLLLLLLLSMLPELLLKQMIAWRTESARMASLLNKVLAQVREGKAWEHYREGRRKTLQVVSDSTSWNDTLRSELQKEKEWLAQVPEGLFAKWSTDEEAFKEDFLKAGLDDEALRGFILHLACAEELGRELNPFGKDEKAEIVNGDRQTICDAVLEAAGKLEGLVAKIWYPHFVSLWREMLNEEVILERLKVSRRSPHNNLFTARFFCHLVGEKKEHKGAGSLCNMRIYIVIQPPMCTQTTIFFTCPNISKRSSG